MGLPPVVIAENKNSPFWNDDSEFLYYFRGWQASGEGDSYGRFVFKVVKPALDGFAGDCESLYLYGLPVMPAKDEKPDFIAAGYPFLLAPPRKIKDESEECD